MARRRQPPRSTQGYSSPASDVYKRQGGSGTVAGDTRRAIEADEADGAAIGKAVGGAGPDVIGGGGGAVFGRGMPGEAGLGEALPFFAEGCLF